MNQLTDEQWQRIRRHFGDVAYEHPEMADVMLEIVEQLEKEH